MHFQKKANDKNEVQERGEASKENLSSPPPPPSSSPPPHLSPVFLLNLDALRRSLVLSLRHEKETKRLLHRLFLVSCSHEFEPCTNFRGLKCAIDVWLGYETGYEKLQNNLRASRFGRTPPPTTLGSTSPTPKTLKMKIYNWRFNREQSIPDIEAMMGIWRMFSPF